MNRSKRERLSRGSRPEFGMAGIAIGLFVGMMIGFFAEITVGRGMIVMQGGAAVGAMAGGIVEALRFWFRMRAYRRTKQS